MEVIFVLLILVILPMTSLGKKGLSVDEDA